MEKNIEWQAMIETALTVEGSLNGTYNRFHNYSFLNQIRMLWQGLEGPVATYKGWQAVGRQVVKGSVAKEIIRPIIIEKKNPEGDPEWIKRFKLVKCIFDYKDTIGEDLPPVEIPDWNLDKALENLEIKRIPFFGLNGNTQGYSRGRELAVNPVAVYPTKTTFHELGHIVLGHTSPEQVEEYSAHRGTKEFAAEATAHLSMNELGMMDEIQAGVSRAYLQHWLQGERPPDAAIRQVFSATDLILKSGRPQVEA